MERVSPEPTVGGVRMLAMEKEKALEREVVMPETVRRDWEAL